MKFDRVDLDRELRADADGNPVFRRCFHHEVMMNFNADSGAEAFRDWWDGEGVLAFSEFYEKFMLNRGVKPENLHLFFTRKK